MNPSVHWLAELYTELLPFRSPPPDPLPRSVRPGDEEPASGALALARFVAMLNELSYLRAVVTLDGSWGSSGVAIHLACLPKLRWDWRAGCGRFGARDGVLTDGDGRELTGAAVVSRCRTQVLHSSAFRSIRDVSCALDAADTPLWVDGSAGALVKPGARRRLFRRFLAGIPGSMDVTAEIASDRMHLPPSGNGTLGGLPVRFTTVRRTGGPRVVLGMEPLGTVASLFGPVSDVAAIVASTAHTR